LAHPNIGYSNATPSGSFLSKPGIGSVLVGEDLQVVDVADFLRGVDVDPDRDRIASCTRSNAWCFLFFTLIQCGERPPR
jgi:hypothetical protein